MEPLALLAVAPTWGIDAGKRRALNAEKLRPPRGRGVLRLLPLSPVEILRARL